MDYELDYTLFSMLPFDVLKIIREYYYASRAQSMKTLNEEYSSQFFWVECDGCSNIGCGMLTNDASFQFNWRILSKYSYGGVFNLKKRIAAASLPENYFYTKLNF